VAGGWRRLHNEDLHKLYTSQNDIRVIKFRGIRFSGHVARTEGMKKSYKILAAKFGRDEIRYET